MALISLPVESLARILNGTVIVPAREILKARVYVAIDSLPVMLGMLTENDIAVIGDDEPAQLALVSAGIACLIVAQGAAVSDLVISVCCRAWRVRPFHRT